MNQFSCSLLFAQNQPPISWLVFLLVVFLGVWILALASVAFVFGWRALASEYGVESQPPGTRFVWQSAQMRWMGNYGNCLTFVALEQGFWVRPMWPFHLWHPGLFFPWEDVAVEIRRARIFPAVRFTFAEVPGVPMTVSKRLAEKLRYVAGDAWPEVTSESN